MPTYRLLSWGANSHGQLGQGVQSEQCQTPREVDASGCDLEERSIVKIVGGAGHTLILTDAGRVYSCGWNGKGQAGQTGADAVLNFRPIGGSLRDEHVADLRCGWDHSAALTKEGALYLWGSNSFGQLGRDPAICRYSREPVEVDVNQRISRVSLGLRHTALVTADGTVLVTGAGGKGQLGLADFANEAARNNVHDFTAVPGLTNVRDIVCGQYHTIAITKNGETYVFGENKYGQLGIDPSVCSRVLSPTKLVDLKFDTTAKLGVGWTHNAVLKDGKVRTWGRNSYGQLGFEQTAKLECWKPQLVKGIERISQISIGSEHNIALTENGSIFCWGWNEHGNCGNGKVQDVFTPERISIPPDSFGVLIGAGAGHSFAVIKDNNDKE